MSDIEWTNARRKLGELTPFEINPRRITEKQRKDLEESLARFSLAEVPVVNTDGASNPAGVLTTGHLIGKSNSLNSCKRSGGPKSSHRTSRARGVSTTTQFSNHRSKECSEWHNGL